MGKGLPFRDAHRVAGRLVALLAEGRPPSGRRRRLEELRGLSPLFGEDFYPVVDIERVVGGKISPGGTAPAARGRAVGSGPFGAGATEPLGVALR